MKRVITLGTFDIPHAGHYNLLYRATWEAGEAEVVVGLNTDKFVERYRGVRPVMTYKEREATINAWGYECVPNDQRDGTIKEALKKAELSNDFTILVGSDWLEKDYIKQIGLTRSYLYDHNINILFIPYTEWISSTELKRRIKNA